jgi:hypothetical protein
MGAAPRVFVVALLAAVLGWAGFEAVRYGVTGTAAGNGARELDRAGRLAGMQVAGSWWLADLARAAAEVPKDPMLHELLALAIVRGGTEVGELGEAERQLKAAIESRAGSPYAWASLVEVKYRIGETGAAFEKALVNAASLGPHEPEVQRTVADYGLAVMDEVGPATRAAIERAVAAGMKRNAPEILQIAARRDRLVVACRHLDGVPRPAASKWTQLCQSMEATS